MVIPFCSRETTDNILRQRSGGGGRGGGRESVGVKGKEEEKGIYVGRTLHKVEERQRTKIYVVQSGSTVFN